MNIKVKGMLFSFILILTATLIIGICSYYRISHIIIQEADTAVTRQAKESAKNLDDYIVQYITPLMGLSENDVIKSMDWEKQKVMIQAQVNPQYLSIAVADLNGRAHYTDESVLNLSDRGYMKEALKGHIAFSDILISRKTGQPVIMVGIPVFQNNSIKGALIAQLSVDFLSNYASTRGYGGSGRAYIISDQGTLISRPEYNYSDIKYNLYRIAKSDQRYQSLADFVRSTAQNRSGFGSYVFDGKKILMGYALAERTNWKIYIGTYESEILDNLDGFKRMFAYAVILSLVLCTIAAWFYVDSFTKPIEELDDLFARGAKGELTIRFTPKTKDEIGRVGVSFNRMMDKIKTLTQYDPLTGLLNQYVLDKDIDTLVHSSEKQVFTLVMLSIDKLSFLNDTFGYPFGDAILIEISNRLLDCCKEKYTIYRYKGDEFVIVGLGYEDDDKISKKTDYLLKSLLKSYQINNKTVDININMGVFIWKEENWTEDPVKAVTQAVNHAKLLGGNQVQFFDIQTHNKIKQNKELQADIVYGLKQNQFFLVYQPLFDLENEKIAELEALIRWKHPVHGMLYPDKFIDLAEASGAIIYIDQWVIESACKLLKSWKVNKKRPVILSVNVSAKTFELDNFIPELLRLFHTYDVEPALLQLEITERMLIKNIDEGIQKLNELRALGIRIAIDDFGIGYSSLSYIVKLPIDSIKIDKSFVQNITSSKEAMAIVSTIISLCKTLKLNVIAEGIEHQTELEYLKSNQCDIGQGYYFSKPVSIAEAEQYIETKFKIRSKQVKYKKTSLSHNKKG